MQPKCEYRRRLPHYQKDNHPLFVTFTTDHRWHLSPAARDIVLDCCLTLNGSKFNLHAAVVMPDHVHLVYSPLRREDGWNPVRAGLAGTESDYSWLFKGKIPVL